MNKTNKIVPVGYIYTPEKYYYLIKPMPLTRVWEDEMSYRFLVVPFGTTAEKPYHKCPREVVFACEFQVEYTTDIRAIECELPYDVMDLLNQ